MPPTYRDFDKRMQQMQSEVARARAVDLSLLHSAMVRAEQLTGDQNWDAYLRQLQGRVEATEKELAAWDERMKSAFNEQDMRIAQINWHLNKSRLNTLLEVMELPKRVVETAKREATQE